MINIITGNEQGSEEECGKRKFSCCSESTVFCQVAEDKYI